MLSLVLGQTGPGGNGLSTSIACGGRPLYGHHLSGLTNVGRGRTTVGRGRTTVGRVLTNMGRGLATVGRGLTTVGRSRTKCPTFHCTRVSEYSVNPISIFFESLLGVLIWKLFGVFLTNLENSTEILCYFLWYFLKTPKFGRSPESREQATIGRRYRPMSES